MIPVSLYICLLHIISIENRPCLKKDVRFKLIYHRQFSKNKLTSTASEISSTILTKRFIHKIKINRRRVTSVIFHWLRRKIKYFFLHYTGVDTLHPTLKGSLTTLTQFHEGQLILTNR